MSNFIRSGLDNVMFFFKRVFKKNNLLLNEASDVVKTDDQSRQNNKINQIVNPVEVMKAENRKKQITQEIITLVDENPKALNYLNEEQLRFIDNYYVKDIKKLDDSIQSLQNDIRELEMLIEKKKKKTA